MTEQPKEHPLAKVARYKMEQAANNGGHKCARWNAIGKYWIVASATRKGVEHHVKLKQSDRHVAEQRASLNRDQRTGFGWLFTLTCDCEAAQQGLFCWHLGAVRLWWAWHHALTGDQIAERNLRATKERVMANTPNPLYRHDGEDDADPFMHVPPMDEWDGTDPHVFNRAMAPMDRGLYVDAPDAETAHVTGMSDAELLRIMLHNTGILTNGGGK